MDIMTYHHNITVGDVKEIELRCKSDEFIQLLNEQDVKSWTFSPRHLSKQDTLALAVWMFEDLGITGILIIITLY